MNIDEILREARQDRGNALIKRHVDLVRAHDENKKLGGDVDYKSILSAIVDSYGTTGVKYSLVREVLYDTEELNAAVKDLVDAKEITKGEGKRDFLLKTTKKSADQPKEDQPSATESNDEDDAGEEEEPPAAAPARAKKPVGK